MSSNFFDETPDTVTDDDNVTDDGDETPEANDTPAGPSTKSAPAQRATGGGLNRAAIRRVAAKAEEVATTDERIIAVAASVLGTGTGLAEVTTAIMAAPRSITAPVNDLNMIATSDQMEAAINATALGRDRIKGVWNLLGALSGSTTPMPAANTKAALAVTRVVFDLDDIAKAEVDAVAALLKKN